MKKQPNILLITTDQQRFDHIGLKGVKGIDTPNLDRLGKEGVHFDRAYTSSPVCTPARMSLLTGQYPSSHGAYSIGVSVDQFPERTLPQILKKNGYETSIFGKTHFVAREDEASSMSGLDNTPTEFFRDFNGPYAGFDYIQVAGGHTISNTVEQHYRTWLEDKGVEDYEKWYPDVKGKHDHNRVGTWNIPQEYHDTSWVSSNTIDWIKGITRTERDKPWFNWTSFQDPHEPFVCPEPWYSSVKTEELEPYEGYREGEFNDKPDFYQQAYEALFPPEEGLTDRKIKNHSCKNNWASYDDGHGIPCIFSRKLIDAKKKEALQATLGMISFIDNRIGKILDALEESGQIDNTIVIFTTDHGEMHGHHGVWHKGLFAYDDCQRIPFLIWGPSQVKSQGTIESLVNLVDIPATIMSLAGIDKKQGMQGVDLSPLLKGEKEAVQDYTIVEMQATENIYQQSFITNNYKLIVYRDFNEGELYHMKNDPDQYINLWSLEEYSDIKTELLGKFVQANMKKEGKINERKAFA